MSVNERNSFLEGLHIILRRLLTALSVTVVRARYIENDPEDAFEVLSN